ncbi:hypothetical protein BGX29_001249 [Mortierella sp. GBA35]|nr:hypothetical protein BGX29_001249 [Mortierella sp. GBA35]
MQSEQDPPAPVSARALKIPEILSAIGDCFYLTYGGEKYTATNRDKLRSILAFIRVSKLWNRTFLPILWYSFDPATMGRFSEHAILTNSLRLKILTTFRVLTGPFDCSNLHTLEILKGAGYNGGPDISLERQLVRANPGLNSLRLRGPTSDEPIALDVEGLAVLESLHELELHRWDNNHLPFFETLRPMAATLTALNLCRIKDFSLGNPMDVDGPTSGRLILQQLEEITMDLDPNCWTPCYAVVSGTLKLMFELLKDKKHI